MENSNAVLVFSMCVACTSKEALVLVLMSHAGVACGRASRRDFPTAGHKGELEGDAQPPPGGLLELHPDSIQATVKSAFMHTAISSPVKLKTGTSKQHANLISPVIKYVVVKEGGIGAADVGLVNDGSCRGSKSLQVHAGHDIIRHPPLHAAEAADAFQTHKTLRYPKPFSARFLHI
eukprot:scaffold52550_cov19-Tisochrysis_lutea.AAC.2